jgi:hypothetical protein
MAIVVVAASTNSPDFAVIEFTSAAPSSVMVGASAGGNVVDCYGTLAAVGDCTSGTVTIFDISHPASPTRLGSVNTGLSGIGAISMDDKNVLAGQNNGSQVALVDISIPRSPTLTIVYSDTSWLGTISTLAMRGTSAVVGGTDNFGVLDFSGHSTPAWQGYLLSGQNLVDFDGVNAAVTTPTAPLGSTLLAPNSYVYGISGNSASGPRAVANSILPTSIAIAEIPSGSGYLLAVGGQSSFWVSCFPSNPESNPVGTGSLAPNTGDMVVAVKFLNNPAVAPLLAVANVTNEGFFVTEYFIQVEQVAADHGGLTNSISLATPNPVAQVALKPTLNPTLGITAFTIKPVFPPPHWPFPLPGWLSNILRRLFG